MLIDKTYMDAASYFAEDGVIRFSRTLGVKRNAFTLPAGFELESINYPSQVTMRDDGRIEVSFINPGTAGVPYEVKARPMPDDDGKSAARPADFVSPPATPDARPMACVDFDIPQRASQSRDIVYFLQQPETYSFRLYHDYEEFREGMDRYLNIVRPGSTLLRITETYTDPNRFILYGDEFVWDRSFGRARNAVVLPDGWYLTANAVPATVSTREDGRVQLIYSNDRSGNIDVLIRGSRR